MTAEEIYAIEPNEYGWRILPEGDYVKLGGYVKLGDYVQLGDDVTIGDGVRLGDGVIIGDDVEILDGFTSLSLTDKWIVHPHSIGKIRCGCYIGDYDTLINRTQAEWDEHGYTKGQVKLVRSFAAFCKANEHLMIGKVEVE